MDEGHRSAIPRKSSGEIWSSFILPCPVPMHYYRHVGQVGRGTLWVRPIGNRPSSSPLPQTAAQSPGHPRRPPPPPRRSADRARSRPTSRAGEYSQGVRSLVGTGRFELPTCRLGGGRSIHLSYVPTHKDCTVLLSLLSSLRLSLRSLCLCVEFTSPQPPT